MNRLIGHMVVRNEMGRYLDEALTELDAICDEVAVFDDQSTDGTWQFLRSTGFHVERRPTGVYSFLENESAFRGAAWAWMEHTVRPVEGDWVICLDADEALIPTDPAYVGDVRGGLERDAAIAEAWATPAVEFPVYEVFSRDGDVPLVRRDGFWGTIHAKRLVAWKPGGVFHPRVEGGGSLPSYAAGWNVPAARVGIMHWGYATQEDRVAKFERYRAGKGHNPKHVASILQKPDLVPWTMEMRAT